MAYLIVFVTSFSLNYFIIKRLTRFIRFTGDYDLQSPQKIHSIIVPRVGGISIIFGLLLGILYLFYNDAKNYFSSLFLLSCIPAGLIGLAEDLTKRISIKIRMISIILSSILFIYFYDAKVNRLDFIYFDYILSFPVACIFFTIFSLSGLTNAYNLIDGLNGLSSISGLLALIAISYVAYIVNDSQLVFLSLIYVSALLGFILFNYPHALMFLGDGGAYLTGFWVGALSILLISTHNDISPWFAITINLYPIIETLFTIYRRKIKSGRNATQPDRIHFHSLLYKRVIKNSTLKNSFPDNSKASFLILLPTTFIMIPGVILWGSTIAQLTIISFYLFLYLVIYSKMVSFNTPHWLTKKIR